MLGSLRRRFIIFSVLVISGIVVTLLLFVYFGPKSNMDGQKIITTILVAVGMVCGGSWLLSKEVVRPIKEAWQKQLDFTADASHELRTPIAVVRTNLELVMESPEETIESQMKWLKNIEAENKRMSRLVDDLLTLSRADTNQQTLEFETFIFEEVIAEVLNPLEPVAALKSIGLKTGIKSKTAFHGDRQRIKQLIFILMDNALSYTEAGGTISISFTRSEKDVQLKVSNTGFGIEGEDLEKIFDRFYRGDKARNANQDGSGLGLSIAKWIAREHKGTIQAESKRNIETSFTVALPISAFRKAKGK